MIERFKVIETYFEKIDKQTFKRIALVGFGVFLFAITFMLYRYYRNTSRLKKQLIELNDNREEVRTILTRAERVHQQQKEVDEILAKEPDFKIGQYFQQLIQDLQLNNKVTQQETIPEVERQDNYTESSLKARFDDMTMKNITQLLQKIEENKRIFTRDVEIVATKKNGNKLELNLTIATLHPKKAGRIE